MRISYIIIIGLALLVLIYTLSSLTILDINIQEIKKTSISENLALSSTLMLDFDKFIKKRIDDFKEITKTPEVQQTLSLSNKEFQRQKDVNEYITKQDELFKNENIPFVLDPENSDLSNDLKDIIIFYRNVYEHHVIDELFITNQFGANVAFAVGTSDYRQDYEQWWQTTKKNGLYVGVPKFNENYNAYSVPIGLRIVDDLGNFIGVLRVSLNLEDTLIDLKDDSKILASDNKDVFIIDNNGTIVFSNKNNQFFYDEYENFASIRNGPNTFEITDNDKTKFVTYSTSTGYLDFSGFGWYLIIEQDESSVLEEISDIQNEMSKISFITISIAFAVGVIIIYSISRPLKKITTIASDISKGNLNYEIGSSRFTEFNIILEFFKTASDSIKQLIKTEKELAETNIKVKKERLVAIGELSSSIAHDLKNPLAVIKTGIDALKRLEKNDPQTYQEVLPRMENAIKRMSHQIEDVMNYVRVTPINIQKNSVQTILESAISTLEIPENIKVKLPEKDFIVFCDAEKIEVVFINLILNSIQAINKKEGTITISISEGSGTHTIQVQDDGEGISEEVIDDIFKPLYTTKMKGTGLGLSICKNIIEQHGWKIRADRDPTRFIIEIPKENKSDNQR